jgi:hypothetical protein
MAKGAAMSVEANKALLEWYADEVLTPHNLAALDEIFHPHYVQVEPPAGLGPALEGLRSG